ncbi:hypothetical protein OC846_003231 [Tilletia horrida]|uniref:Protein YTP1-like C-terminal domain-containing protein n=1 Tax=Tilletia horrida TaxID=155126 RepID=A0AAN6JY47_9BASI|nr:hypothetical protein OC846_003231 [Tilletia horrida]KAK0566552.1 hypothetical protein OC861_003159 [Tilletia horrida]
MHTSSPHTGTLSSGSRKRQRRATPTTSALTLTRWIRAAALASVAIAGAAAASSPSSSRDIIGLSSDDALSVRAFSGTTGHLSLRHGDHAHEEAEEQEPEHHHHDMSPPPPPAAAVPPHEHEHEHGHQHSHSMQDSTDSHSTPYAKFSQEHGPFTAAADLPDPWKAGPKLLPIPPPPPGLWGGHHHHGDTPALTAFNETALFYSKGPAPLSYVEWDMSWGPARTDELRRFVAAGEGETNGEALMGAVDGRWRRLFDEWDPVKRAALNKQMKSFVENGEPTRHAGLMFVHVLGCILACFVLLPITLVLRAGSSSLAPLAALTYLVTLFFSIMLGGIYKALSPPLFPSNSHGTMAWALFWISAIVFSFDIIKLLRQIASVFVGPRAAAGSGRWRNLWGRMTNAASQQSTNGSIALQNYEYSPVEEDRILQSGYEEGEESVALAKNIDQEENTHTSHYDSHAQQEYKPRPVQRNGSSSSSGSGACPSPNGTLVGTPRNSTFGPIPGWDHNGAKACPSTEMDLEKSQANEDAVAIMHGRPAYRQHRRGLSSISTLWERDSVDAPLLNHQTASPRTATSSNRTKTRTTDRQTLLQGILRYSHVTVARSLPILAFAVTYTGITVYSGACRSGFINGCAAHGIKGGIFFWFGLLTFGRYVGAYAEHGWAWNARPKTSRVPSAEFVESFVIFLYGATNTWMERFGAKAGDPYSVKQVQHISIAVMYWFAGLVGILIETKWTKRLLGLPIALTHPSARRHAEGDEADARLARGEISEDEYALELVEAQRAPPSYAGSFNPFPALCIGVTGVAMAAHHQDYVYEVEVHALWGNLLAAFAVLRCLTYFFLYLRPPTSSILPGRPPTEALASFALACGGMVFMLSSEEVSFLAMRTGWSDIMMITNVTVALVCLVFCGIAAMLMLKAWAVKRELRVHRAISAGTATDGFDAETFDQTTGRQRRRQSPPRFAHAPEEPNSDSTSAPVFVVGEELDEEDHMERRPAGQVRGNDNPAFTSSPDALPANNMTQVPESTNTTI